MEDIAYMNNVYFLYFLSKSEYTAHTQLRFVQILCVWIFKKKKIVVGMIKLTQTQS